MMNMKLVSRQEILHFSMANRLIEITTVPHILFHYFQSGFGFRGIKWKYERDKWRYEQVCLVVILNNLEIVKICACVRVSF